MSLTYRIQPYAHQLKGLEFAAARKNYALLMEQGTGKTMIEIIDAARRWESGDLYGMVVFAPNGVHTNWVLRELPAHMPPEVRWRAAAYYSSPRIEESAAMQRLFEGHGANEELRVLAVNWEALITEEGRRTVELFCSHFKFIKFVGDESQRVKNPKAIRTKKLMDLRLRADFRSILSGTAITNAPFDAYSQFGFLDPRILQIPSFTAFKAQYAELLPPGHGLLRHIAQRTQGRYLPQIVAKDSDGRPKWRNLQQLEALLAPHSYRVLKKDCLDLPEKVYTQIYFRMTTKQHNDYKRMRDDLRLQMEDGLILPVQRIAALTKLSQIVSGYVIAPGVSTLQRIMQREHNPKLNALMEELEDTLDTGAQVIVWARFHAELDDISARLKDENIPHVVYSGAVDRHHRSEAIDKFQRGEARVFVGQQAAGGTGITLTAASTVIYYSNSWSLEDRLQSEDRAHRIGQRNTVRYVDIVAQGTIDERITTALRAKTDLASVVLGDTRRALEMLE